MTQSVSMDPRENGYRIVYRVGSVNHCPGCGGSQWLIGRAVAECAYCSTAIPLRAVTQPPLRAFQERPRSLRLAPTH